MGRKESTTLGRVFALNRFELVMYEANPPVERRQPVENVLVKTKETYDGMARFSGSFQAFIVLDAEIPSVPEKRDVRHIGWD